MFAKPTANKLVLVVYGVDLRKLGRLSNLHFYSNFVEMSLREA